MRFSLALLVVGCAAPPDETPAPLEFLNHAPEVEYVGMDACRQCHLEQFSTFVETGMGRAFYPMTPEVAVEDFSDDNEFVVEESGLRYRMEQRDGKFYQRQYLLDSRGREIAADERELSFVIGSNNHSRSYVTLIGDKLFQAPICWYPEAQTWDLCPGFDHRNDHFGREINLGCVHCHNGKMRLIEGERNEYEKPYPHGIGCERCHGPGQLHVERWADSADNPTAGADMTIVNPRRLALAERISVCSQCHLGDSKATDRVGRWKRDVNSHRPGQRLTDFVIPFAYKQPTEYDFGLSAQVDRLILSRCYQESGGKMECLTCHDPHVTVYHEQRPADYFRRRCVGCHATEDCVAPDARRQATKPADDCVACHMRKAEPDDQRFTEMTDHWIRRDIDIQERDHREDYTVAAMFPDWLDDVPEGEQAYYHGLATSRLAGNAPIRERPAMLAEAARSFERAIETGFDNVNSWHFLGKMRKRLEQHEAAVEAYERAHAHDPTSQDPAFALGQALLARGEIERGLSIFQGMLEHDPDDVTALAEIGRVMSEMGRPEETLGYLDHAIREQPWTTSLHLNQAKVLAQLGRFDEAAAKAADAVRLDPDDREVWYVFQKAHEAANRLEAAAEARRIVERLGE